MLISEAQIIIDDQELETENPKEGEIVVQSPVGPLEVHDHSNVVHDHEGNSDVEITISVDVPDFESPIPGVDPDSVEEISVSELSNDDDDKEEEKKDEDEAKDKKTNPKWDWKQKGAEGFLPWLQERFKSVPRHSGKDSAGVERAIAYLNRLDREISTAMKNDVDEELNYEKIEAVRSKIEDGIVSLEKRLKEINKEKKKKRKNAGLESEFIKEAKVLGLSGNYVQVPLIISALARMCINGSVSAGHSMEENINKVSEKFKLNDREKFELAFLIQDMGFYVRADRYFIDVMDKPRDKTEDGFDFAANYNA